MIITVTQRLIVRQFRADGDDAAAMGAVFGDAVVMRFSEGGVRDRLWIAEWLRRCCDDYERLGFGLWAVVEKDQNRVTGYCGLTHFPDIDGNSEIELGYRLARSFWGCGYATEAATAVLNYGFGELKLPRLVSLIDPANVRSIRVAEKIGMRYEKDVLLEGYTHPDRLYAATSAET